MKRIVLAVLLALLATAAIPQQVIGPRQGGTGVSNAGTITNASNTTITGGGTLALGGFTLTAPATGTALISGGALGTPSSGTLTNATGLPIGTGLSGFSATNRIPYSTSATTATTSANLTFDGTNFGTVNISGSTLSVTGGNTNLSGGVINGYNGITTAGLGVPVIVYDSAATYVGRTTALTAVTILTVPASDTNFEIGAYAVMTTVATAGTIAVNVKWTDAASQAQTNLLQNLTATTLGTTGYGTGIRFFRAKASTTIQVESVFTGVTGSPVYQMHFILKRVS